MGQEDKMKADLTQLEFLLTCKVKAFHDEGYEDVSVDLLEDYLINMKWKKSEMFLHEMAKDVQKLTYAEVIDYLRLENIFHAKEESIRHIFNNLI